LEAEYRRAPSEEGGREVLPMRQPTEVSDEFTVREGSHLDTFETFPPEQPNSSWLAVSDAVDLTAQQGSSFQNKPFKLSILMAAYNEEKTIIRVVDEILKADCPCEIELIVVDDGSTDSTPTLLSQVRSPHVVLVRHSVNQGKGAALLAAASLATGTHVLPFDADLEYVPEDIPGVLKPVLTGRCDVVYGVRLFGCNTVYPSYVYAVGNRLLTHMANLLFNAHLTDLHTCLKLLPLATLKSLDLREKGFGLDSEITARLLSRGIRPFEVPVSYYGRSHADGKKIRWRDAVACGWILLRVRVQAWSRRKPPETAERSSVAIATPDRTVTG
jgi:hypothetical protein